MAKRKRWAIALVFLCVCIFGYQQLEVALASPSYSPTDNQVENPKVQENNLEVERVNFQKEGQTLTLDGFIEKTIQEQALNEQKHEPYTILKTNALLKKEDLLIPDNTINANLNSEQNIALKKIKQMQKIATYISDNYNIPLGKAESIVYSTFVESKKKNLEPMLVLSLISVESMFDQYSRSSAGAVGLTQVMARVHKNRIAENKVDIWSVLGNIKVGTDILKDYVQLANGNMRKALQMYNGTSRDPHYRYSNKIMTKMQTFMLASR